MQEYDEELLASLSKKYQVFLDSPNGEINVFLVLSNEDELKNSEIVEMMKSPLPSEHFNMSNILTENNKNNNNNIGSREYQEMEIDDMNNINNINNSNVPYKEEDSYQVIKNLENY